MFHTLGWCRGYVLAPPPHLTLYHPSPPFHYPAFSLPEQGVLFQLCRPPSVTHTHTHTRGAYKLSFSTTLLFSYGVRAPTTSKVTLPLPHLPHSPVQEGSPQVLPKPPSPTPMPHKPAQQSGWVAQGMVGVAAQGSGAVDPVWGWEGGGVFREWAPSPPPDEATLTVWLQGGSRGSPPGHV